MGEAFTDIYCKECVTGQSIALCGGMQETGPLPEASGEYTNLIQDRLGGLIK